MTEHRNPIDELAPNRFVYFPHICFLCAFSFSNFVFGIISKEIDSPEIGTFLVGAIVAQFGLLVVWSVFGRLGIWKRLLISLVVGALLYEAFVLGVIIQSGVSVRGDWRQFEWRMLRDFRRVLLPVPLVLAFVQLPCWLAKVVFGWTVSKNRSATNERPFRIQHLMGATAAIAILITLARWGLPEDGLQAWAVLGITCAVAFGLGLLILLPLVWATLKPKHPRPATIATACFVLCLSVTLSFVLWASSGVGFGEIAKPVVIFISGLTAVLVVGLATARSCGYRLGERIEHLCCSSCK